MVEFIGTAISKDDGKGRWFRLTLIEPTILTVKNKWSSFFGLGRKSAPKEGEITLTFDDKITANLKDKLGDEYLTHLNKKRVIIKFE